MGSLMKLVLPVLVLAAAAGVGIYVGFFRVSSESTPEQSNITVSVDKDKLGQAKDKAKDQLKDFGQEVKEKANQMTKKPTTAP
jgi:ABC-type uncharacterized transport system substrate-binding protein